MGDFAGFIGFRVTIAYIGFLEGPLRVDILFLCSIVRVRGLGFGMYASRLVENQMKPNTCVGEVYLGFFLMGIGIRGYTLA